MKWLNGCRIRFVSFGFVAAVVLAVGGRAKTDFVFGKLQNLGPMINSPSGDVMGCFSANSLELYFSSNRPGGYGYFDIYVTTRATKSDPWGPPLNLGPAVNTPDAEICPSISSDGLTLYFSDDWDWSPRPGGLGGCDIWMIRRASRGAPWGTPVNVGAPINTSAGEITPKISGDGLILAFASNRAGGQGSYDLWMSTRATIQDNWGAPVNMGGVVNSGSFDHAPNLSSDERALVFTSNRPGGFGGYDLWMTTRKTPGDPWGPPVNLGPRINSSGHEDAAAISADAWMLYFLAHTPPGGFGGYDLWEAPIIPIIDFNGDGQVDIQDLLRLIESWGKDDPSVDMGPMPWGNGKIDTADLEILMSYWGQEVNDPTLIAHWKLDEVSGMIATDSAGSYDGILERGPVWQPSGGTVAGAIQLDGVDDYIKTPPVLSPSDGTFSLFAWVKSGAPGQVILSQVEGANWLMANSSAGLLMTQLKEPGRKSHDLVSPKAITDGRWHRVGLTWDGSNRILYVDGVEAAKDAQASLAGSTGKISIGAGSALTPGSFWKGLIDDVRIYDRAVKP
jgi:hypothetical protein